MHMWKELFSKISLIIGRFKQVDWINYWVFGVFSVKLSANILSLCFLKKTKILRHFKKEYLLGLGYEFRLQRVRDTWMPWMVPSGNIWSTYVVQGFPG